MYTRIWKEAFVSCYVVYLFLLNWVSEVLMHGRQSRGGWGGLSRPTFSRELTFESCIMAHIRRHTCAICRNDRYTFAPAFFQCLRYREC